MIAGVTALQSSQCELPVTGAGARRFSSSLRTDEANMRTIETRRIRVALVQQAGKSVRPCRSARSRSQAWSLHSPPTALPLHPTLRRLAFERKQTSSNARALPLSAPKHPILHTIA